MSIANRLALLGGVAASVILAGAAQAQSPATAVAASPAVQSRGQLAPLPDIDIPYTRFVLNNGLTLIVHEDHKAPIVAVNIWYHVGSANEPRGRSGFAHLFEHLMFNGSENFNDDFFKGTQIMGATDQNGTTNNDRTNYFQNVPTSALDSLLWLESDRMGHLTGAIDQARLDEQRGVVQNEKREGENQPYGRVWDAITNATYPDDHPYGHTVIGSMEDLDAASLSDVRDWFQTYYGPANATIVLAGDITPEEARAKVEQYFGDIPPGPPLSRPTRWISRMQGAQREVMYDRVGQPRVHKVWNVPPGGEAATDYLGMLGQVLSSGRSSRLYNRLVMQDETAVSVFAGVSEGAIGSQFMVMVTAKPGQDLAAIEAVVDEEMARLLRDGPTAQELERARTVVGAGLVRGLERIGGFGGKSDRLAESQVFHGDPGAWRVGYQRLNTATPADLTAAGRDWLTDGSYTLEVLPFPDYAAAATGADRSVMPSAGAAPAADFPDFQRAQLSNGLKIILAPRTGVPTVNMNLIFDAGSAADPDGKEGLASLTPSAMTNGTERLSALEVSDQLQLLGAGIGGGSGVETTSMSLSALANRLEPSLALFADVLLHPAFRPADFSRTQAQQVAGIQQMNRNPGAIANRVMSASLYGPDSPYGRPTNGEESTVQALTPADAQAFHQAWMRPDNATLVVVGDITMADLQLALERAFAQWRAPSTPIPARDDLTAAVPAAAGPRVLLVDRPGPQSNILAGRLAPAFDAAIEPQTQLMNTALGGSFTSRINMNLREDKHWSYGASSGIRSSLGQRAFIASAGVQSDKTIESLAEMRRELSDVVGSRPMTDQELAAFKTNLVLRMAGGWETNGAVASDLQRMVVYGLPETYFDGYAQAINDATATSVSAAARAVVGDGPTTWVIVGDRATIEPRLRELGLGEVQVVDAQGRPVE
jgi:zinc protease